MMNDEHYDIRNPEIEAKLRELGRLIGQELPRGWGFSLLLFSFKGHELFYISNAQRQDVAKAMTEFAQKFLKE